MRGNRRDLFGGMMFGDSGSALCCDCVYLGGRDMYCGTFVESLFFSIYC